MIEKISVALGITLALFSPATASTQEAITSPNPARQLETIASCKYGAAQWRLNRSKTKCIPACKAGKYLARNGKRTKCITIKRAGCKPLYKKMRTAKYLHVYYKKSKSCVSKAKFDECEA